MKKKMDLATLPSSVNFIVAVAIGGDGGGGVDGVVRRRWTSRPPSCRKRERKCRS